ncbi:MAG: sigma factor-like helix-turn-helix DNA-binding protein, partial [Desulfobacterales bacterium]|nr:sigma factor-like helix-turn-helix DNA-binding protein [Desulfobacterales bacterium]
METLANKNENRGVVAISGEGALSPTDTATNPCQSDETSISVPSVIAVDSQDPDFRRFVSDTLESHAKMSVDDLARQLTIPVRVVRAALNEIQEDRSALPYYSARATYRARKNIPATPTPMAHWSLAEAMDDAGSILLTAWSAAGGTQDALSSVVVETGIDPALAWCILNATGRKPKGNPLGIVERLVRGWPDAGPRELSEATGEDEEGIRRACWDAGVFLNEEKTEDAACLAAVLPRNLPPEAAARIIGVSPSRLVVLRRTRKECRFSGGTSKPKGLCWLPGLVRTRSLSKEDAARELDLPVGILAALRVTFARHLDAVRLVADRNYTLEAAGKELGVSRERVRQILVK